MVDTELINELDEALHKVIDVSRVSAHDAESYLQALKETFIANPSSFYWWESLKGSVTCIPYKNNDSFTILEKLLYNQYDVLLIVTDGEESPWPIYAGSTTQLIAMLRKCRFCEYMLAPYDMSWIVFDTHMNELIIVGL